MEMDNSVLIAGGRGYIRELDDIEKWNKRIDNPPKKELGEVQTTKIKY